MISNKARGTVISDYEKICRSTWSKASGLMFTTRVQKPLVFVYNRDVRQSIHMMFVFHSIDLIFLDRDLKVVEILEGFRPFTTYRPKLPSRYMIECAYGTVRSSRTHVGDEMNIDSLVS